MFAHENPEFMRTQNLWHINETCVAIAKNQLLSLLSEGGVKSGKPNLTGLRKDGGLVEVSLSTRSMPGDPALPKDNRVRLQCVTCPLINHTTCMCPKFSSPEALLMACLRKNETWSDFILFQRCCRLKSSGTYREWKLIPSQKTVGQSSYLLNTH